MRTIATVAAAALISLTAFSAHAGSSKADLSNALGINQDTIVSSYTSKVQPAGSKAVYKRTYFNLKSGHVVVVLQNGTGTPFEAYVTDAEGHVTAKSGFDGNAPAQKLRF